MNKSSRRLSLTAALATALLYGCTEQTDNNTDDNSGPVQSKSPTVSSPSNLPTASPAGAEEESSTEKTFPYQITTLAEGLSLPWEIAFAPAPDSRIFFTERPGNLRVIVGGKLQPQPLLEVPAPSYGEGGLLGLTLDPDFANNGYAYVYHSYPDGEEISNRILRLKIGEQSAEIDMVLLDDIPGSVNHNGGRIKFGPDGMLYVTTGDRSETKLPQDITSLAGKILRLAPDGSVPKNNPFEGSLVYSYGHRNPQGLAWQPETSLLYSSEHGSSAHDEINLIEASGNYGWPLIQGDESGSGQQGESLQTPLVHSGSNETWAPSGMTFITQGPWSGELLVAALAGQRLLHITLDKEGQAASLETLFEQDWGRLRNVAEGPDGTLYVLTSNLDRGTPSEGDDRILALTPTWK
ncbi:PQQ-dependent sugar dehydrogenase [Paenibacillus herberti]|nr:PQQ-dependent sugar dehydrogenase [Paenibacillus herberti]